MLKRQDIPRNSCKIDCCGKATNNPARAVIGKHVKEIYRHAPYWKALENRFY